jgi:hypothetical protein
MAEIVTPTSQELFPVPNSHVNYTFVTSNVEQLDILIV